MILDEKISIEERRLTALEKLKAGLMQKIFSRELRFKRDDGTDFPEWKYISLGDLSESLSYGMNSPAKEFDGTNKYLRITDIDERSHGYILSGAVSPASVLEDKYLICEKDVLVARTGNSVGKSYLYKKEDGTMYFAGFLIRIRVKDGFSPYFVFLQTLTKKYKKWVSVSSKRSGQPGINAEQYSAYEFECPSFEEQKKISSLFQSLDEKILNATRKIKVLKKQKAAFMQQMFI